MLNQMKISCILKSFVTAGLILATVAGPIPLLAQTGAPEPVAEFVIPSELASQDKAGFLAGLTAAVAADPERADEIVAAALQLKLSEIETTPDLATEIVLAVIAGLPPSFLNSASVAAILNSAVSVLKSLPVDLTNVSGDVVEAVLVSLPPELAEQVKGQVLAGPQGALRDLVVFLFTVPPRGGEEQNVAGEPTPTPTPTPEEDAQPEATPVTPTVP